MIADRLERDAQNGDGHARLCLAVYRAAQRREDRRLATEYNLDLGERFMCGAPTVNGGRCRNELGLCRFHPLG